MEYLLGIDIGTSGTKTVLFREAIMEKVLKELSENEAEDEQQ